MEAEEIMTTRIKLRRDTAAAWLAANPILSAGEPGLETDTGKIKYGDGVTHWADLAHNGGDSLSSETAVTVQTGDNTRWINRLRREDNDGINNYTGVFVTNVYHDSQGNIISTAAVDLDNDGMAVFKYSPSGAVIWKYSIAGYGNDQDPQAGMAIDSNDDIWVTVYPNDPAIGLIKLSGETGEVLFTQIFYENDDGVASTSIAINSDNDLILTGQVGGFWSDSVLHLAKIIGTGNNIGNVVWTKRIDPEGSWAQGVSVAVDYLDNIIVTGTFNNQDDVDKMVVIKFDTDGACDWQEYIELNPEDDSSGSSVAVDDVGNIYVTGAMLVKNNNVDIGPSNDFKSNAIMIVSLTSNGDVRWSRRVGPGPCSWVGTGIAVGEDGDLYLVASTVVYTKNPDNNNNIGYFDPSIVLARYNKLNGKVVWQKYWNNPNSQDVPAGSSDNSGPTFDNNYAWAGHSISVYKDKVAIGGSTRMGPSDFDGVWSSIDNFNQGFVAQFDTDASEFEEDGYKLETSRVPGKLETGVTAVPADLTFNDSNVYSDGTFGPIGVLPANISVRKNASKANIWTFERNGDLNTPADTNIKLNQSQQGYGMMYGYWENNESNIYYQAVVRDEEGCVYTAGSTNYDLETPYVTKLSPTGEKIWEYEIKCAEGANFYIEWSGNEYSVANINQNGSYYKVGDRITIGGEEFGGDYRNNLILNVDSIYDWDGPGLGGVASVSIVSGVAPDGNSDGDYSDYYGDGEGAVTGIAIDPKTKNIVVCQTQPTYSGDMMDSQWSISQLFYIDSDSGALLSTTKLSDAGDVYVSDVAVSANGVVAVAGTKYNEYLELATGVEGYGVQSGLTGINKIVVPKDQFTEHYPGDAETYYNDCWLTGDNIVDQIQVTSVNRYTGLTTTTRQGSGANFDITADGAGAYTVVLGTSGGTNYLQNHKIKVLGSALGGVDVDNDAIINVEVVDGGVITNISITGTSTGSATTQGVSGTNYNVGAGAVMELWFNPVTGVYTGDWNYDNYGSNYVVGDVLTITGAQFAGGATPANNITFTVTQTGNTNNGLSDISFASTPSISANYLLIRTNTGSVNLAVTQDLTIKKNLGGEAFVWSPGWEVAIGGPSNDGYNALCFDSENNIIAVGYGQYDVNYQQGLVVKYDGETGAIIWSKYINPEQEWMNNHSVALMADDSVVVAGLAYNSNYECNVVTVTKVDTLGEIVWQNQFFIDDDDWPDTVSVAVDPATDEIIIAFSASIYADENADDGDSAWYIVKLDTDGEVLWKRIWSVWGNGMYIDWNESGGHFVSISNGQYSIAGTTYATIDYNANAALMTMPVDGTGTGQHGLWTYFEPKDNKIEQIRINTPESLTFTPHVNELNITTADNDKFYFADWPRDDFNRFTHVIRSEEGGAIEFADGSKQSFSATIIPQVKIDGKYTLRPEDSGRHIYVTNSSYRIWIPNWARVTLPVGFTITIINRSGDDIYLYAEDAGEEDRIFFSGGNIETKGIRIADNGSGQMVTLVKFEEGEYNDDADSHGGRWMVAGADIGDDW